MGFPRQEDWSGLPFLSPGDLPDPGIEPVFLLLHWQADSLPTEPPGKPLGRSYPECWINDTGEVPGHCPRLSWAPEAAGTQRPGDFGHVTQSLVTEPLSYPMAQWLQTMSSLTVGGGAAAIRGRPRTVFTDGCSQRTVPITHGSFHTAWSSAYTRPASSSFRGQQGPRVAVLSPARNVCPAWCPAQTHSGPATL